MASANLIHRFESKLDLRVAELSKRLDAQSDAQKAELGAINAQLRFVRWGIGFVLGLIACVGAIVSILIVLPQ